MPSILLVDDEEAVRQTSQKALETFGLGPVECVADGDAALTRLCDGRYDLCLLDLDLGDPRVNGMQILATAKALGVQTPITILSGVATREETAQAMKLGAEDVWFKPLLPSELAGKVRGVLEARRQPPHVVAERLDRLLREGAETGGLRLRDLCDILGISESYGEKLFRTYLHMSFRSRLRLFRVAKARELLMDPRKTVKEVADESGFGDRRRLHAAFVRLEGMSPTAWRRKMIAESKLANPAVPATPGSDSDR